MIAFLFSICQCLPLYVHNTHTSVKEAFFCAKPEESGIQCRAAYSNVLIHLLFPVLSAFRPLPLRSPLPFLHELLYIGAAKGIRVNLFSGLPFLSRALLYKL